MEKKYLVLVYCKCSAHNFFFEIEDDLEQAKSLARAASTDIDTSFASLEIIKVKLLDISNNKEIDYQNE